jgi:pyrroline-5-carboxylate reductase
MNETILIIGLGNMGKAIVKGMITDGINPNNIHAVDISEQAKLDANKLGITIYKELPEITPSIVLIAIKPQMIDKILPLYKIYSTPACVFLSIAAGTTIDKISNIIGGNTPIIRSMPNTPAAIGKGMTVLCANKYTNEDQQKNAEKLLATTGETAWVENESLIDTVTAVSGSGPAYFFLMMEALTEAGVANGLPQELAQKLAVTTAWGAGSLAKLQETTNSPAKLREMVTSPNGTTAAGLEVLNNEGLKEIIKKTVTAAKNRSKELS